MRHKRLSQKEIDFICKELLEPLRNRVEEVKKKIAAKAIEFIDSNTPPELLPFIKSNSPFLNAMNVMFFGSLRFEDRYIHLGEYVADNWLLEDKARTDCEGLINDIESVYDELNRTRNRITCALNTIKTTRKLEQEWPEAYQIYIDHLKEEEESSESTPVPGCDQVESLRAELSSLKQPEND